MAQLHLQDLPESVKDSIARALQEKRVVQHIPADMSGAKLEQQYKGIAKIENGIVHFKNLDKGKVTGFAGIYSDKLKKIKAALKVNDNFGIAIIGNKVEMIRHIAVYKTLSRLRKDNPGQKMTVLKKGMLIRLSHQKTKITEDGKKIDRNGIWRVVGITDNAKNGVLLELSRPERISNRKCNERIGNRECNWRDVSIHTLIKSGMEIVPTSYIGS